MSSKPVHGSDREPNTGVRRPSLHTQHKNLTHTRLIAAALEKFTELGYHATTIEDIVGAAGASRSTFYLHFKSKIDVVRELIAIVEPEAEAIFARLKSLESPS